MTNVTAEPAPGGAVRALTAVIERPFMIERGVPGADQIPDRVRFNPLVGRSPV